MENIKFSEAIRIGCKKSKPQRLRFFGKDKEGNLCACAMGAGLLGLGFDPDNDPNKVGYNAGFVELQKMASPEVNQVALKYAMKFDDGFESGLTREQIADMMEAEGL